MGLLTIRRSLKRSIEANVTMYCEMHNCGIEANVIVYFGMHNCGVEAKVTVYFDVVFDYAI